MLSNVAVEAINDNTTKNKTKKYMLQKRILWVTCGKIRGYPIGGSVTVNFGQLLLDLSFVLIIY